jgi:hypothetical protein
MTLESPYIFISHSSKDKPFVHAFAEQLGGAGLNTWVDVEDILDGDQWVRVIQAGVESCGALLVVWSANARASVWVEREVLLALRLNKPVFITLIDDTPLPIYLIERQASDLRSGQKAAIQKLVRALNKAILRPHDSTPSPDVGKPTEHNFFKYLEQLPNGGENARVARALFAFGERHADAITFSGKTEPAFHAHLWLGPGGVPFFSVRAYRRQPAIEIPLQFWMNFPPYDQRSERLAVLDVVNSLLPERKRFAPDRADLRPNIPLGGVLSIDGALDVVTGELEQIVKRLKAGK